MSLLIEYIPIPSILYDNMIMINNYLSSYI